jgi:prepilin-type N-terminal cleavage/methylation domain-containing protein
MKNNRGFTLVELLISFTILLIVLTLMGTILVQSFDIFRDSTERVSNNRLTQIMIEDITQNIREYKYFDFATNNTWKFSSDKADEFHIVYDDTADELRLEKPEGEIFRTLSGVVEFKLENYASEEIESYNRNEIEFNNGIIINFEEDKIKFDNDIKIEYVDTNNIEQEKTFTDETEIRLIEGNEIRLEDNTKINRDNVREIIVDGTEIDFNNNAFEFNLRVNLRNNNVIEELKTVYPRNFSFWR